MDRVGGRPAAAVPASVTRMEKWKNWRIVRRIQVFAGSQLPGACGGTILSFACLTRCRTSRLTFSQPQSSFSLRVERNGDHQLDPSCFFSPCKHHHHDQQQQRNSRPVKYQPASKSLTSFQQFTQHSIVIPSFPSHLINPRPKWVQAWTSHCLSPSFRFLTFVSRVSQLISSPL